MKSMKHLIKNDTKNKSSQPELTRQPHDLGNETGTTQ